GAAGFAPAAFPLFAGTCGPFQRPAVLDTAPRLCYTSRVRPAPKRFSDIRASRSGRIAQLVEQLTLNQRVQGSNPCAPTNLSKHLADLRQVIPTCRRLPIPTKLPFLFLRLVAYGRRCGAE